MSETEFNLLKPPIVEAVLDIECDLPPAQKLSVLETPAREAFLDHYPKVRTQLLQEHEINAKSDVPPEVHVRHAVQAYQFLQDDEKQLVQIRVQGFSFNRLAPYSGLDDYMPEIKRAWHVYLKLASPVQIRSIRLRYINRILLPTKDGRVELNDFFRVAPHLPDEQRLTFVRFLNQHVAVDTETGHRVDIVLVSQPQQDDRLPVIFDNSVAAEEASEPENWTWIEAKIKALRTLKNRIFRNTLTDKCLELFQKQ